MNYLITSNKVLSVEEEMRLRNMLSRGIHIPEQKRDCILMMLTLDCGLRASEAIGLRVGDFNPQAGSVIIQSLKGSNKRELPLRLGLCRALERFTLERYAAKNWNELDPVMPVFGITYPRYHQIWAFYRPSNKKTLHSLRHSFAVRFYEKNKDIKALQMILGHRQISNTMVYVDFYYSQTVLRRMMT